MVRVVYSGDAPRGWVAQRVMSRALRGKPLLGAVADALDPGAMVTARPDADLSLLCVLVTERAGTVAGAFRGLLAHPNRPGAAGRGPHPVSARAG